MDSSVISSFTKIANEVSSALEKFTITPNADGSTYKTTLSSLVVSTTFYGMVSDTIEVLNGLNGETSMSSILSTVDETLEGSLLALDRLSETDAFTSIYGTLANMASKLGE